MIDSFIHSFYSFIHWDFLGESRVSLWGFIGPLGVYFAKKPADRTGDVSYHYSAAADNTPVLDDSMVFFGCEVKGAHVYGDHTIYVGEVTEMRRNDSSSPLMFFNSRWSRVTATDVL